jgi:hypothetical protein
MTRRRAVIASVVIGLLIALAVVLAGGVDTLDLQPGRLVEIERTSRVVNAGTRGANQDVTLPSDRLFTAFVIGLLVAAVLSAIFMTIDKKSRPKFLFWLAALALLVLVGVFVPNKPRQEQEENLAQEEESSAAIQPAPTANAGRQLTVPPPEAVARSAWPVIVTAVLATALAALSLSPLAVLLIRFVRRRRGRRAVEEVLAIAAEAAREIESGGNPIGVVQRCYARMLRALSESSGVDPLYRTPREFAVDMRAAGLHDASVDALTEMFELVRYGGRAEAPFAKRAVACLTALRLSHEPS